jgi:hypothetical protein
MGIILVFVPSVSAHKIIEGIYELVLTGIIREVVSLEIVQKDVILFVKNVADLSTLVKTGSDCKDFISSMSDHFSSILAACGHIMITLYPKFEVTSSLHHFIVSGFVLRISLHVVEVFPQIAAADAQNHVKDIGSDDDTDTYTHLEELFITCCTHCQTDDKDTGHDG